MHQSYAIHCIKFCLSLLLLRSGICQPSCVRQFTNTDALLVIDVQNSFLPGREVMGSWVDGGSLAAENGSVILPVLREFITFLTPRSHIFASLDWHPINSCSFCSRNTICAPYGLDECGVSGTMNVKCPESMAERCVDPVSLNDYDVAQDYAQWPIHCVQGNWSAHFDASLPIPVNATVVKKGFMVHNDSYSAFGGHLSVSDWPFDNGDDTEDVLINQPDLKTLLESRGITRLFVSGIAIDYCVKNTILDAMGKNVDGNSTQPMTLTDPFSVALILAAATGVNAVNSQLAVEELSSAGAVIVGAEYVSPSDVINAYCDFVDSNLLADGDDDDDDVCVSNCDDYKIVIAIWVCIFAATLAGRYIVDCRNISLDRDGNVTVNEENPNAWSAFKRSSYQPPTSGVS